MKRWQRWAAGACLVALAFWAVFDFARFEADFWPLDASRVGPNLVASVVQWGLVAFALYLLYPPFRAALDRYTRRHVDELKAHVEAENAHLHMKLNHIVRHTKAIPNEVPGLPPEHQP